MSIRPDRSGASGASVLVWRAAQGLMDVAMDPEQLLQVETVLHAQVQAAQAQTGVALVFDSLRTRQAGGHSFIDLHLHLPGDWSLAQAADWRHRTEAALMAAIPSVQVHIELLPQGAVTVLERQTGHRA